ncbi:MAG: hypothetical protein Q7S58_17995, partial [Candidatus Binatus sp.]
TTDEFLELFGLKDLEGLPDLSEFREIERAVEQANIGPIESVETHPEDAIEPDAVVPEKQAAPSDEHAVEENSDSADLPPSDESKSSS